MGGPRFFTGGRKAPGHSLSGRGFSEGLQAAFPRDFWLPVW